MKRVYFDADGVVAKYISTEWAWWLEKGIFKELEPQQEVIEAAKELQQKGYEIFILTAYHKSTPEVRADKLTWFRKYTPFISEKNIIFTFCGENKADYIPSGITKNDILLDDFNANLEMWKICQGQSIKVLNGINSKESWNGLSVSAFDKEEIISVIESI